MPKSKRGPSLVELMRSGGAGMRASPPPLPSWRNPPTTRSSSPDPETPGLRNTPATDLPAAPTVLPKRPTGTRYDRVVLSFSSVSAGVTVFVFIALLTGGFLAGREMGMREGEQRGYATGVRMLRADTADEIQTARAAQPNTDIFAGLRSSPITTSAPPKPLAGPDAGRTVTSARPPATKPDAPRQAGPTDAATATPHNTKWITDYTYVIVQEFRSEDHADALEAREFLGGKGVDATILESRGRYKYRLVADKGFNCDDPNQRKWCDEFHAEIQELGRLYVKAGGRYDLQGYQKKLTGTGW